MNDLDAGNQEHVKIYEFLTCWEPRTRKDWWTIHMLGTKNVKIY